MKFVFNKYYFCLMMLLFIVEVLIAVYLDDSFIRPYFGDYLVVMLIYCFVKSFFNTPVKATCVGVLLFAYLIETLQFFEIVKLLGLQKVKLANIVIGNSFSWHDLIAYTLGVLSILMIELVIVKKVRHNNLTVQSR